MLYLARECLPGGLAGSVERCGQVPVADSPSLCGRHRPSALLGLIGELGECDPDLFRALEQGVGSTRSPRMAALETAQYDEAVFDLREPLGRRPDAVPPIPHASSQILHFNEQIRTSVEQSGGLRVQGSRAVKRTERDRQLRTRRRF